MKLIVFLAIATISLAQKKVEKQEVYCGRRLATALALLCEAKESDKRSSNTVDYQYDWPWIAPRDARAMSRGKRQVVKECCDKPCSVKELTAYC